jgi:hypothetical protein
MKLAARSMRLIEAPIEYDRGPHSGGSGPTPLPSAPWQVLQVFST